MTGCEIRSVELGAIAIRGVLNSAPACRRQPPWESAIRDLHTASHALVAEDPHSLRGVLASEVWLSVQGGLPAAALPRREAVDELLAWRGGWRSCGVVLAELLMSGSTVAATGFVIGIDAAGGPSCVDIHLVGETRAQ